MEAKWDLVIRKGTIVDGTGGKPYVADLAVTDGTIRAIGDVAGTGRTEIDAEGKIVTPGFVDVHTHYDGQAIWSDRLSPSSLHGVTTIIMGNCGVGFAPSRPSDRDNMVSLMEGVEDIPGIVITTGLTWDWETFPQYLDAVDRRPHDIDIGAYIPHSPLRVYVMGDRALRREPADESDIAKMKVLVKDAIAAGALGFGTSRTTFHRTSKGDHIPSFEAAERELHAIGDAMKEAGAGVLQIVPASERESKKMDEIQMLLRLAKHSGRPLTFTFGQSYEDPDGWKNIVALIRETNRTEGTSVTTQVLPKPIGIMLGFSTTFNPFMDCPSYLPLVPLSFEERMIELRKPEMRARLIAETPIETVPQHALARIFDRMYTIEDPQEYEPSPEASVAAVAKRRGVAPEEVAFDLLMERDGRGFLYVALSNYANGNLDFLHELMGYDSTILALGDGGAHYGFICDASYPTFTLVHWARDRSGAKLPLEVVVKKLSRDPARVVGLNDRGQIGVGYKADLNVMDFEKLNLGMPYLTRDMPGNGQRFMQRADGYVATIVNGVPIYRNGEPTGALPGRLVRGAQKGPEISAGR